MLASGLEGLPMIVALVLSLSALAILVPLTIFVIRRLNETWFDPDWQARRKWRPDPLPRNRDLLPPSSSETIPPLRTVAGEGITKPDEGADTRLKRPSPSEEV